MNVDDASSLTRALSAIGLSVSFVLLLPSSLVLIGDFVSHFQSPDTYFPATIFDYILGARSSRLAEYFLRKIPVLILIIFTAFTIMKFRLRPLTALLSSVLAFVLALSNIFFFRCNETKCSIPDDHVAARRSGVVRGCQS
jgi:hypothetical protein